MQRLYHEIAIGCGGSWPKFLGAEGQVRKVHICRITRHEPQPPFFTSVNFKFVALPDLTLLSHRSTLGSVARYLYLILITFGTSVRVVAQSGTAR